MGLESDVEDSFARTYPNARYKHGVAEFLYYSEPTLLESFRRDILEASAPPVGTSTSILETSLDSSGWLVLRPVFAGNLDVEFELDVEQTSGGIEFFKLVVGISSDRETYVATNRQRIEVVSDSVLVDALSLVPVEEYPHGGVLIHLETRGDVLFLDFNGHRSARRSIGPIRGRIGFVWSGLHARIRTLKVKGRVAESDILPARN